MINLLLGIIIGILFTKAILKKPKGNTITTLYPIFKDK